jgi:hypothetical protein
VVALITALLAFDFIWVVGLFVLGWLVDVPLGPVNLRAQGEQLHKSAERNIEAQHKLLEFWRRKLRWVALGAFVLAIGLMVVGGSR